MKVQLENNQFSVRLVSSGPSESFAVNLQGAGGSDVDRMTQLTDVDTSNLTDADQNRFVLVYDASTSAFKFVNPDEVIDAATGASTVPGGAPPSAGISAEALQYLDDALDDKVDLDAGSF
jgi:hypothetical protein